MPLFKKSQGIMPNEYLYSTVGNLFNTYTLSLSAVTNASVSHSMANLKDDKGNYYANKGWLLAKITSGIQSGKVGPYDSSATDGRQTSTNIVGFLDTFSNLEDGDKDISVLYVGTVKGAQVYVEGTQGDPSVTIKDYLRTASLDVLFK